VLRNTLVRVGQGKLDESFGTVTPCACHVFVCGRKQMLEQAEAPQQVIAVQGMAGLKNLQKFIEQPGGDPVPAGNIVFQLTLLGIAAVFFTGFWSRGGQTLGMRAWRLRVESRSGKGIGAGTSLLRFAGVLVSISVFGLGFLWLLVDRDKLSWHDRLAGTRVVVLPKGEDPTTWRAPVQPG
jgi:hypothetical protein